ncbi:MAG: 4-hydroxy-tetrahydrodipicolinate synthase [Candidatus Schekmanbacteria bacterium]|nr:MAG: 4-hydroxy-tetrahydrodipicolinate synthase [Candidatus Schekmanbacteria bacterium]
MFKGSLVAIVTPFKDDKIDWDSFEKLIEFHIEKGTNAIVPCGTTGESATLSPEEHKKVIEFVVEKAAGRIPIVAGTGSNSTKEAIILTKEAEENGVDGCLLIAPYYNKPTQEGLFQHFSAVAKEVSIPLILYNIPSRTGINMLPSTVQRLASEHKNIVGIKEASGSLAQMQEIIRICPSDFVLLSGDDALLLPVLSIGGKGVISVVANIVPERVVRIIELFEKGDIEEARKLNYELLPLVNAMFYETNPIPVKKALALMGMINDQLRLPLVSMSDENTAKLKEKMKSAGII